MRLAADLLVFAASFGCGYGCTVLYERAKAHRGASGREARLTAIIAERDAEIARLRAERGWFR